MGNDVRLKIGADTSELERAFGALIKKIQGDADKLKLTPTASKMAPGTESVREASQTSRNINQRIREEKAGLDIINRELSKKKALIDEISRRQEAAVKGSREELALAQRLNREKERLQQTEKVAQIQKENFRKVQEASDRSYGGGGGRGPGGGSGAIGGMRGPLSWGSIAGIVAAGVSQAYDVLSKGAVMSARSPIESQVSFGSAMQGTVGKDVEGLYSGKTPFTLAFASERQKSYQLAEESMKAQRAKDQRDIFANVLKAGTTGAIGGATAGGIGGSFIPGIGNIVGAGAGGAIGGLGGALTGIAGILNDQNLGALARSKLPFADPKWARQYESMNATRLSEEQQRSFQGQLGSQPERVAAAEDYLKNYQRNLDFQRQTGLDMKSFRGGYLNSVFDAGFTDVQGMGMSSGILGAGGSTRSAVGNAALGLQAQRNLDLTNAGGVLGKLSGGLGSAETTKEAFVKILAEGTRAGLDGSEFREENRKFVESAAQAITQSGTTTAGGVEQIMGQFGRFFGDRTNTGIEAGKNAYDLYRQTSMATTGPRGTMRAAGMLADPTIRKLDRDSREALFNMPIDQLTPDNPAIAAMAKQANVTPQQLIDAQNKVTASSANQFVRSDIATKNLSNVLKKYGRKSASDMTGPFAPGEQDEITRALGESNIAQIKEHPELGQNQRFASQYSEGLARGDSRMQMDALEDAKKQQLQAKTTGRPEDETNRLQAEVSKATNQMFLDVKDSILPASSAVKDFTDSMKGFLNTLRGLSPEKQAAYFNENASKYGFGSAPTNAPSAGSPSSGGGSGR